MDRSAPGKVYLVGGGPGDPGLLTVRGKELLARADVVTYDHLVNEALLEWAPRAEHVYVGKSPGFHMLSQDDINQVLIEQAARHAVVVRLKGGDPFVFGRGSEEAAALTEAGIPFEVVPGISAGIAVPAYAGIPVTRRGVSSSLIFLPGHRDAKTGELGAPIANLIAEATIVIFMGLRNLDALAVELVKAGRTLDTPAAAIEWGTMNRQRTVVADLRTLAAKCRDAEFKSPVLTIIGEVVNSRETISWFEDRPLFGRRIIVTKTRGRAAELANGLRELGADVLEFPTVRIEAETAEPPPDFSEYDWIVLTSVNSVDYMFDALRRQGLDARALHGQKLCAISSKTAEELDRHAIRVDAMPERYDGDSLVRALEEAGGSLKGQRILMPRADIGRSSIPETLRARGAEVTELRAYETPAPEGSETLAETLQAFAPDYITFSSAAAVQNFQAILGAKGVEGLGTPVLAAIGPIASEAGEELGLPIQIVPRTHRVPALIEAIVTWDRDNRGG